MEVFSATETVSLPGSICLTGYQNEYVFERIKQGGDYYEADMLKRWFSPLSDYVRTVYDIGANMGNHTIFFASHAPNAQIYSFEPFPANYQMLKTNVERNAFQERVFSYQLAIGDHPDTVRMRIGTQGNLGTAGVSDDGDVLVQMKTLDSLNLPPADFIKIDVEGFELAVLRGMEETLKKSEAVIWLETSSDTVAQVASFLTKLGYELFDANLRLNGNLLFAKVGHPILSKQIDVLEGMMKEAENWRALYWDKQKFKTDFEKERKKAEELKQQLGSMVSKVEYEQNKADELTQQLGCMASKFEYEQKKAEELKQQLGSVVSKFEYEQNKTNELTQQLGCMSAKYEEEQKISAGLEKRLDTTTALFEREQNLTQELLQQLNLLRSEFAPIRHQTQELQEKAEELAASVQAEREEKERIAESCVVYRTRTDYFRTLSEKHASQFEYEQKKATKLAESCEIYRQRTEHFRKLSEKRASQFEYEQKKAQKLSEELAAVTKKYDATLTGKLKKLGKRVKGVVKPILFPLAHKMYHRIARYPKILKCFAKLNKIFHVFSDTNAVIFYGQPTPTITITPTETLIQPKTEVKTIQRKPKNLRDMNVAMIVDEFTYNSFRYECNALPLEPSNWKSIFEENDIDFFFCESAWTGTDPDRRPWRGQIYSSCNFPKENRTVLLEILEYCKEHKIPTAFWNKEDPTHYEDKVHNFVDTAKHFDHVFTTASECVERYKQDYGLKSVHLLMFATQPRMFNPIETCDREDAVIFAGSWYNQHPVRCQEMGSIFDGILDQNIPLVIYNRQSENSDPNHQFPEKYVPYVRPRLRYDQMDAAYKGSNMALNINTVVDSETMFARRVFELMSSNTFVLSNYSLGMEKLFGDLVAFVDGTDAIDVSDVDAKREAALCNVLSHHTYQHRFEQMVHDIGLPFLKSREIVTLVYRVETLDEAQNCVQHFMNVTWAEKQAVLLVSRHCDGETLRDIVTQFNQGKIQVLSEHYMHTYGTPQKLDCMYAAWANTEMAPDFIARAMLHWCYLPEKTGICAGDMRYTIGKKADPTNVLLPRALFDWDCNCEKDVYFI